MEHNSFQHQDLTISGALHAQECAHMNDTAFFLQDSNSQPIKLLSAWYFGINAIRPQKKTKTKTKTKKNKNNVLQARQTLFFRFGILIIIIINILLIWPKFCIISHFFDQNVKVLAISQNIFSNFSYKKMSDTFFCGNFSVFNVIFANQKQKQNKTKQNKTQKTKKEKERK